jgi:hypothetical protein
MSKQVKEDTLYGKVVVVNKSIQRVDVGEKYAILFRGRRILGYGKYEYKFPIEDVTKKRLVSAFQLDFQKKLRIAFTVAEIREYGDEQQEVKT